MPCVPLGHSDCGEGRECVCVCVCVKSGVWRGQREIVLHYNTTGQIMFLIPKLAWG